MSVTGHEVQHARLRQGYWNYNPGVLSWWYRPLREDQKIEPNPEKKAQAEESLRAIAYSHLTVRAAAKAYGLTEGKLFNLLRDPFCQGKIKEKSEDGELRWVRGSHPPVVDPVLIEAAKAAKPGRTGARKLLSEQQRKEAISLYETSGLTIDSLAARFKVSYATMQRTVSGFSRRRPQRSPEQ
jgi:transposase-like protein